MPIGSLFDSFPNHPGRSETLDDALLKRILLPLRLSGRVLKATWLDDLVRDLADGCSEGTPDRIRRHVLWLVKYEFLESA